MHQRTQDAMVYVRKYGRPDLFITFTCNPKWPEIVSTLFPGQIASDRHDVVARVFHEKHKKLMWLLTKGELFGKLICWMTTTEWQKRGLPHTHTLVWCVNKIPTSQMDDMICAELPDPHADPILYETIKTQMLHGPCGTINPASLCMENGKCKKRYPRAALQETQTGHDGYPRYRRRLPEDGGQTCMLTLRGGVQVEVDNTWVVPHNKVLCKTFNAHINVESCSSIKSIKYVCKYVNKGSDMAVFGLQGKDQVVDEVNNYQLGRYISSNEAVWRLFGFDIHDRYPAVVNLSVHLENGQRIYFTEENARQQVDDPTDTTLTAYSNCAIGTTSPERCCMRMYRPTTSGNARCG